MTDCLLLFSGGLDSMLTAAKLACSDCRVHLLCCNNGSVVHEEIFQHGVKRLQNRFGDRVQFEGTVSTMYSMQRMRIKMDTLTAQQVSHLYPNVRYAQFQCTVCQTCMWIEALAVAKARGYTCVASGYKHSDDFCTGNVRYKRFIQTMCAVEQIDLALPLFEVGVHADEELLLYSIMPRVYEPKCSIGLPCAKTTCDEIDQIIKYIEENVDIHDMICEQCRHYKVIPEIGSESLLSIDYPTDPKRGLY